MKWPDVLHVDTNLLKLKFDQKVFWVDMVRNDQFGHRTLKLTVSQEWADEINWFFLEAGANLGKLKVVSVIFGWFWSFSSWDSKIWWMSVWIELILCMLTVMQQFLVKPVSYSISLTYKCQSIAVYLLDWQR